jgi:hypothetical protein
MSDADPSIRLSLSVQGLQRLESLNHEKDFAFIVGDKRYSCPTFVAEFLSPRIASLRSQDLTIQEFSIATDDPGQQFGALLSIGFGGDVSFLPLDLEFVRSICRELGNYELFGMTLQRERAQIDEMALRARQELLYGTDGISDWAVPAVASHFHEFSDSDFDNLSPSVLEAILSDPTLVIKDEDSVFGIIDRLGSRDSSYFGLLELVRFEFVSSECMERVIDFISSSFDSLTFGLWLSLAHRLSLSVTPPSRTGRFVLPAIDSKILSGLPEILSVFGEKRLQLLYRGSLDGFEAATFHDRCDEHPKTLTLVSSTNGAIFGGYTPLAWISRGRHVPDRSLKSFLFTIKNPHGLPAQIFKQQREENAIGDNRTYGPTFGGNADLYVCDECHRSAGSYSYLGGTYANDTGIDGKQVFTGSCHFTVKEIEVFEVI